MAGGARGLIALFPKSHYPIILYNIFKEGKTLKKRESNEFENRLTRRLCISLKQNPVFRDGPLSIHSQQEILSSDPDDDFPIGYIDILISCEYGSEVYFAIEAKRLRVRSVSGKMDSGNADYVNEGMMRFVTGQYAPYMNAGAMLGYVFDGDTAKARSGVSGYIQRKAKTLKLMPPEKLVKSSILPDHPVDETKHCLGTRTFVIYHMFIPV